MTSSTPRSNWIIRFLQIEASAGIVLVAATVVALVWANSPFHGSYADIWHRDGVHRAVNDGLMTLFFFVVGLEIKRELVDGELASPRVASLPVLAAVGGMAVPAALYSLLNAGGDGARGWGVPTATDIAFAASLMAVVGRRAPHGLKVLLLSLAVVDDIGAIVVIAVFYSGEIASGWLVAAAAGAAVYGIGQRFASSFAVVSTAVVGVGVWAATLESGVHATIAGVALGLLTASHRAERLESALHPWTGFVVVPVFALANAGLEISAESLGDALSSRVTLGVVVALVIGKFVGVAGAAWAAVRAGVSTLPAGVTWRHVRGVAALAGIGFTVSLFIAALAFEDARVQDEAKLGVLLASAIAAAVGTAFLLTAPAEAPPAPAAGDERPRARGGD